KREQTFALRRAQFAIAQQAAKAAIGFAIFRIGENVRGAVEQYPRGPDQQLGKSAGLFLYLFVLIEGAYHTGERVAVCDADGGVTVHRRLGDELLGMRRAAQKGEIGRNPDFSK